MRQAAAQQHNDDDDARDPPHHEPETLAPVAPGRDLGHVRTRRQAAFTPTINVLYQPQREPSAAPPSRDPWRTEIEGGASPGGADFSDVEQGRVSGRSLFILSHSLPLALGRRCLTAPCPGPMAYRACAGAILFNRAGHLLIGRRNTTKFEAWQFPQGGVEAGETFQDEALREAEEEFGIPRTDMQLVTAFDQEWKYQAPASSWLTRHGFRGQAIRFCLVYWDGDTAACNLNQPNGDEKPEFSAVKWMPRAAWATQLTPFVADFKRELYRDLQHLVDAPIEDFLRSRATL